jgi:hypothetical protein
LAKEEEKYRFHLRHSSTLPKLFLGILRAVNLGAFKLNSAPEFPPRYHHLRISPNGLHLGSDSTYHIMAPTEMKRKIQTQKSRHHGTTSQILGKVLCLFGLLQSRVV